MHFDRPPMRCPSASAIHLALPACLRPLRAASALLAAALFCGAVSAQVQPRFPALQPLPAAGDTTQGGSPKGKAKTQEGGACSPVPCGASTAEPRIVVASIPARHAVSYFRAVADVSQDAAASGATDSEGSTAFLRDVLARADVLRDRRTAVSVSFCVARPQGEERPRPVRLELVVADPSKKDVKSSYDRRMRQKALQLRFVWKATGEDVQRKEVRDCYLGAQAYSKRPKLLVLRGVEPRKGELRIENAFHIEVLKLEHDGKTR